MRLIVAEGAPSRYAPMQVLMSSIRWDHLVDQLTSLDLEGLGVPVQWECVVDYLTETFRYYVENAMWLTVAHAPD
jgi:hypothetical protein